ncbi:MAG: hypothetical protein ACE37K_09105 [Planctomycetota bacterium]
MRRAGDSGVRRAAFALLVVGLAVAGWWFAGRDADRVAVPAPERAEVRAEAPREGAAAPVEFDLPIERRKVAEPGVRGQLCDHLGRPVPFCRLQLYAEASSWAEAVELDEEGRFAFAGCPAGRLSLMTIPPTNFGTSLELEEDEGVELDLRLPADMVATHGTFDVDWSRRRSAHVRVRLGGEARLVPRASDGRHHAVMPVGEARFDLVRNLQELAACSHVVPLPVGCGQQDWSAPLRCQDLRVELEGPVGKVDIFLRRVDGAYTRERRANVDRKAWLPLVPPGDYELTVRGRYVARQPPTRVRMLAESGVQTAVVAVSRVASVRLLFESRHRMHGLDADNTPVLMVPAGRGEAEARQHRWQTWGKARFGEYGFLDVPPGPAQVVARDRIVDGAWRYLAFDPVPDLRVVVLPNRESVAALQVEARAHVDLRACSRSGMEQFGATIEVFAGDVPVHSRGERCSHFAGHLPVGDYRIVIDRGGSRSETGLQVGRRDVRLRLRP